MLQRELDRAVARATGESVSVIAQMGFVPLTEPPVEREPLVVDWDALDDRDYRGRPRRRPTRKTAA
jgi:hypothetical protein